MGGRIFLVDKTGELVAMDEQAYDAEARLQTLLVKHPDLLDGSQINPDNPRRWLLVQREAPIPIEDGGGGYFALDHLFLDQDGVPTLVEVKRASDTRIRREVIAQMLDYAANLAAYWSAEQMRAAFERRCENGSDPDMVLQDFLGDEAAGEAFWQAVHTNLLAKRLRLLFVADHIPGELRRVIEFLNETMDPVEVLGIEIPQYVGGGQQTLAPRVVGQTTDATQRKQQQTGSPLSPDQSLALWNEEHQGFYQRLLKASERAGWIAEWRPKGFSLWLRQGRRKFSFVEAYTPGSRVDPFGIVHSRIGKFVQDPDPVITGLLEKLDDLGIAYQRTDFSCSISLHAWSPEFEANVFSILTWLHAEIARRGFVGRS